MINPFEHGPDRSLVIAPGDCRPITLDGYLLMLDERYERVLAAFDAPTFNIPCVGYHINSLFGKSLNQDHCRRIFLLGLLMMELFLRSLRRIVD